MGTKLIATTVLLFLISGCVQAPAPAQKPVTQEPKPQAPVTARYRPVQWSDLPSWPGEQLTASWSAWLQSCTKLRNKPQWQSICDEARVLSANDVQNLRAFFERRFTPYRIETSVGEDTGLITGYYEILLSGGFTYKPGRVPLYGVPDDMLTLDFANLYPELKGMRLRGRLDGRKVVPYWNRSDIANGKIAKASVVAWADDAMDAAFLQVQGSGRMKLDDGSTLRLGYADQNGHPYKAMGKWLIDNNELPREQVSMQNIRAWVKAHPERREQLLDSNPSYVFMRALPPSTGGPIGALNVPLTEGASVAVDSRFIPLGSPLYLTTTRPDNQQPLQRLVNAQDTGGAIRGPVRADYYWGSGHAAGDLAGNTKQRGQLWLLWPKDLALPH